MVLNAVADTIKFSNGPPDTSSAWATSSSVPPKRLIARQVYAYRDRRAKKRDFRQLWIARLSAAAADNGISYSRLFFALKKAKIELDRKVLSDIAIVDPKAFSAIVDQVRTLAPKN